jgi:Protein of unknown function (DUF3631)
MTLEEIVAKLQGVRGTGGKYTARCPAHDDTNSSLSISQVDGGKILVNCFAGCEFLAIVDAMGLKESDFFPEKEKKPRFRSVPAVKLTIKAYAEYVGLPDDFLRNTFKLEEVPNGIRIPYLDENGNPLRPQIRLKLKKGKGDNRFIWDTGVVGGPYIYGAWALPRWAETRVKRLLLVEGPSDVQVLWFNKIPAMGAPGADSFKPDWTRLILPFAEIVLIEETDKGGPVFVKKITDALVSENYQGTVKAVQLPKKDIRDLWLDDANEFRRILDKCIAEQEPINLYPTIPPTRELIFLVRDTIKRFVFIKEERIYLLIAVWVVATFLYESFWYFPYLWINSPGKRSGKTRLLEVLGQLVNEPSGIKINPSVAVLYNRTNRGCTLFLDEMEKLSKSDHEVYGAMMAVLNGGFQRGATVDRMMKGPDGVMTEVSYNIYGPKILAGIRAITDTVTDRSFIIRMIRKVPNSPAEAVERFNLRKLSKEFGDIVFQLKVWAEARRAEIEAVYDGIQIGEKFEDDRLVDIIEPLLSIAAYTDAESANGDESKRIFNQLIGAVKEVGGLRDESQDNEAVVCIIETIGNALGSQSEIFIYSADLTKSLQEKPPTEWIKTTRALSTQLSKLGLFPRPDSDRKKRGYRITRQWFDDIITRYPVSSDFKVSNPSETDINQGLKD